MRGFTLFLLFTFFGFTAIAQNVVLQNNRPQKEIFFGLANWLTVMADGYSCDKLVFKPDSGRIENRDGCSFHYFPAHVGKEIIRVFAKTKNGLKAIGAAEFLVRKIPLPVATVGGFTNADSIDVGAFKVQMGVGAYMDFCCPHVNYTVTRYHLFIMKDAKIIFDQVAPGNSFSHIRSGLLLLEPGQTILISEIMCIGEDGKNRNLAPLQYFLK